MIESNWPAAFGIVASIASILAVRIMILRRDLKAAAAAAVEERKSLAESHRKALRKKDAEIHRLNAAYTNLRLARNEDIEEATTEGYRRARREYDEEIEAALRCQNRQKIADKVSTARRETA